MVERNAQGLNSLRGDRALNERRREGRVEVGYAASVDNLRAEEGRSLKVVLRS